MLPVEVRPISRVDEFVRIRNRLGSEFAHEPNEPGETGGEVGQIALVAVVPAEVEVTVGPVELRKVWKNSAVGDGRARLVGLLERTFHPAIENALVPTRELVSGDEREGQLLEVEHVAVADAESEGLVVRAPHRDRRMVPENVDRFFGLTNRLAPDLARVAPLQREVLPDENPQFVGGFVGLGPGHVSVHADEIEPGVLGQGDVTT